MVFQEILILNDNDEEDNITVRWEPGISDEERYYPWHIIVNVNGVDRHLRLCEQSIDEIKEMIDTVRYSQGF